MRGAALLQLLLLLLPGPAQAEETADAPAAVFTVTRESGERLASALGFTGSGSVTLGGQPLASVKAGPGAVVFEFTATDGEGPLFLYASRPENPPLIAAPVTLARTETLYIYAAEPHAEGLADAARDAAPAMAAVTWRAEARRSRLADTLTRPPLGAPEHRALGGPGTAPDARRSLVAHLPVLPYLVWSLFLALLLTTVIALRGRFGPGAPLALLPGRSRLFPILSVLAVAALALALRLFYGLPGPLSFVEVQRAFVGTSAEFLILPLLFEPFRSNMADPLSVQSVANAVVSAALPVLLLFLGTLWGGRALGFCAALIAATLPAAIRFAQTNEAGVLAATFLVLALLMTELFARRPSAASAASAGLAWVFLFHTRPESPAYVLVLAFFVLLRPELRRALFPSRAGVLLVTLIAVGLALDAVLSFTIEPPLGARVVREGGHYLYALRQAGQSLYLSPRAHPTVVVVLAVLGLFLWLVRPPRPVGRGFVLVPLAGGVLLPLFLAPLGGLSPLAGSDVRYGLIGWPLVVLLAAAPVARLLVAPVRGGRAGRPVAVLARVLGVALLALAMTGPLTHRDYVRTPSPLQLQHRFLAHHAHRVPDRAVIAVAGIERGDLDLVGQITYRLRVAFRAAGRGEPDHAIVGSERLSEERIPEGTPVLYLQGFFDFVWPAFPVEPPPSPPARVPTTNPWRDLLRPDWTITPIICTRPRTHRYPPPRAHGAPPEAPAVADLAPEGLMELCLYRLERRE